MFTESPDIMDWHKLPTQNLDTLCEWQKNSNAGTRKRQSITYH
jgi:hypothetical protein